MDINNHNFSYNENYSISFSKVLYGIISGIQSFISTISGFLDIFYLLKEFKIYVLENIFKLMKYIINLLKYSLSFQFIKNKNIRLVTDVIFSAAISLCLILLILIKKEKENQRELLINRNKSQINECFDNIC